MSHGTSPYTTVACLKAADKILGPERVWNAVSEVQTAWLEHYVRLAPELRLIKEIESNATREAENHIAFLTSRGWDKPQIESCGPNEFLTAAVLDAIGHWSDTKGERTLMKEGTVEAASLSMGTTVFTRRGTSDRCVSIKTKNSDVVWLEPLASAPNGLVLSVESQSRYSSGIDFDGDFEGVIFPMIDFSGKVDNAWLKDLWTKSESGRIARLLEAKQALQLKVNEAGFRARAADEMRMVLESYMEKKPPFIIDRPFLMTVMRPGLSLPFFTAHLEPDVWKNPGTL
jgi:hypothetical protein